MLRAEVGLVLQQDAEVPLAPQPVVRLQCECEDILHCCSAKGGRKKGCYVREGTEGGRQNDGDYRALTLFELAAPATRV